MAELGRLHGESASGTGVCWKESNRPRKKWGTTRSILTDEHGLPLSVVLFGANTHDVELLEAALEHIVALRPEPEKEHPQNLCLDVGYTGSDEKVNAQCYTPHIPYPPARRGKEGTGTQSLLPMPAAGLLRSLTLFSIVFVNSWCVMKRKLFII